MNSAVTQPIRIFGNGRDAQVIYWRSRLAGAAVLELAGDRPRTPATPACTREHVFHLPPLTRQQVHDVATAEGTTELAVLLAAFSVLLARWSGQTDLIVGIDVPQTAGPLPLRTELANDPSFRALLTRVQEAAGGVFAHADLPLVQLLEAVDESTPRPLFHVTFSLDVPAPAAEADGVELSLRLRSGDDGVHAALRYAPERFDAATAKRMADHYCTVLNAALADPGRPVWSLPMLPGAERARIAALETEPAIDTDPQPFTARFAAQARRTPDAPAILFGRERISYAELDARSSRLANHLRRLGAGPESRVGVCLERTPELVVALLAILRVGAAYVPLEPYFPHDRIKSVLGDAGASLLVMGGEKAASPALPASCAVLAIDDPEVQARIGAESARAPDREIHPQSLAHVIYTSGSTGKPKGVMIRHGSVAAFLSWMERRFPVGPGEQVLGSTSVCFDVHVAEVHHTLASGGALVLVKDALSLAELPAELGIVQASMVPTAARELLRLGALPGTIRRLNLGGEPVAPDLARDLYAAGLPEVHNLYGPTEDTTYSTHAHIPPDGRVTIGRQIAGSRAYVLDAGFHTAPLGVTGDLYLAGAGVSRGYLSRPGMTAERYLPDPRVAGERMYATGDRARWLPNGELEYFGRGDFQVKVRGYRIEPGEIEAVLRGHPRVENAVVAARGEESARRLVAWIVAEDGAAPGAPELAEWVRERLPEYMVPSAFARVDAFPRTTSGKVDRKALPDPDFGAAARAWVAPRTPAEQLLSGIFAEVLQVERIGADDDFFELGGHSLMATRLVSRVRELFGVEMTVRTVFDHPTLAGLADRVSRMDAGPPLPPVTPTEQKGPRPLSFSQQRLWFLEQLEPGGPAYNVPVALRLRGVPDVSALERSLGELVRRHESLRTAFAAQGGDEPVQVIAPAGAVCLPVQAVAEDALAAALLAEAERPFDLARGPLFRARLFRTAPDEHALVLVTHHAVTDGWSVGVLFRELQAVYGAYAAGHPSPLSEPRIQYADFAVWQRTHQGPALQAQVEYWRRALSGAPPALELPTDRPRPSVQSHRGASYAFTLPPQPADALRAMARREGATLYMALLAGWTALLGRYAGQDDVVVGSPVAGRTQAETEGLIGFFVNTLALRTRLDGDPTVRQLLARVREATLSGFASQDVPFERVVEAVGVPRDLARSPLFQVMFVLQDGAATPALPGLETIPLEVRTQTAKFDLTLSMEEGPGGLGATLHYATDLFDAATAERMAGHLLALLEGMAAGPERRVADLPLVTDAERARLAAWNRTEAAHPRDGIVQRFQGWAARTPDATAVACEERTLSYAQANEAANRLAHHLRALGVTPETRVGICLERGADAVVALLGVLKAGGAYVPVDPAWPAERITFALADAGASVVLTTADHAESAIDGMVDVVRLDADASQIAARSAGDPPLVTRPEHLAYVIYTSGSTGRPKGVMIEHRQLRNYVDGVLARLDLPEGASFGTVSTLAADLGNTSVFPALCTGGALHVITHDRGADPDAFAELMRRTPVDVLKITPSHLAALLSAAEPRAVLPRLRLVLGGEASRAEWVKMVRGMSPELRILNHYGPTETTVGVLTYGVDAVPRTVSGSLPLGRPLDNSRVYVLDPRGGELPVGVPGELCVGGAGVGRGYLGRPGMSAETFIPDPFAPEPGARMYRTGDRARRLADGAVEFLGRVDDQVKIRGFRIEPGEVGAVLSRHPGLREAAVVARTVEGEARLAAYVVAAGAEAPPAAELRTWLRRDLPDAMVPSTFVTLDALPLTANGKVDRRALPEPEWAPELSGGDAATPRTPAEEMLAGVWAELLGVERVGPNDNFFQLGGHSLLATRMLSGIRRVFGVDVPVRAVFEAPTVAALAQMIAAVKAENAPAAPPIVAVQRDRPLPLSFAQQRLWFLDQLEPGSPFYNMPYALRLSGALNDHALERAIGALVNRHESLRTVFAAADGEPVQRVTPAAPFVLAIEPASDETDARRMARDEALRPFHLSRGPLFRARLLRIAPEDHVLLVTVHHAVADGWSLDVLFRELGAFYATFVAVEDAPLPPPAVQYPDFAVWQRRWMHGAALDAQLAYWRGALAGAPPALELPTDRPRPPAQSFAGAVREFHLPPEVAHGVRALARKEGVTVFMTLLAAFDVVLARWSGQDDVVVGSPMAGRTRPELEGTVGFFVNTLPLRTDLSGDPSFRELVARVRVATMGAYAHQELPFERLVDDLKVERDPSRNPLFQVTFVLQNEPRVLEFGGMKVGPMEVESGTAKFDLTLAAQERSDGLACAWEYNTDLFDAATIERMTGHLSRVVASVVADPARPVSAIDLLADDERELLRAFSATRPEAANAPGVLARIAEQIRRAPHAVAVVEEGAEVTYSELDARANRLARHLRARGVDAQARVGICLERGAELVAAVLAVLRAGGAYVPVDPAYPPDRRAYMLADSGAAVLVTRQALAAELEPGIVPFVLVDADAAAVAEQSAEPLAATDDPAALAYVVYTSGSTGRPKGVQVTRRGVRNLVDWHLGAFGVAPGDRTTLVAGVGFDASAWEIWPALAAGAALHVPADEVRAEPAALQRWMIQRGITLSFLPTPLAEAVLPLHWPVDAPLRALLTGGDALRLRPSRHLPFVLVNNYGPTECAVVATSGRVEAEGAGAPDIGRPIDGAYVYIVDAGFRPAPVGVPGELCVGGAGVARGYGGRPSLTAHKFVPDPLGAEPGARMYRTGDRVRWRPDGRMEFLGRMDQQVKVRGYRIELGEIEAALLARGGVREAVAVLHQGAPGDRRLVGYVVADEAVAAGLRDALKTELPDYMVPAAIVRLDALPLTPNGKVDRRALPPPRLEADGYVAPRTPAEEVLAAIWAEVLGASRVGADDGFFDLGGHSLLATRVVSRVREAFRVELPLRALFEAPTVARLAARIAREEGGGVLPPVRRTGRRTPPPLSFAQQRLWFLDQLEPGSAAYNVPTALRIRGPLDVAALERAIGAMVARHETLRTAFVVNAAGEPVQAVLPADGFRLPVKHLHGMADPEAEARRVAAEEAATPFDLAAGPLFRATLLRLAQDDRVLLVTLHHAVTDGWSMGVFWSELRMLYAAFLRGEADPLTPLPVQYADYAVWQREHLAGPVLHAQLRWWRERLAGAPAALVLPTDRPRPPVQSHRGAAHSLRVARGVADGLRALARREGATLYMTLLAAFNVLLGRWSGQEDLVVGSPVAGRARGELEGLIGFLVNSLPLRTDLSGDPAFRELLGRVREAVLEAHANQDVPFERLVEEIGADRDPGRTPVFQVLFAFQEEGAPPALQGAEVARMPLEATASKFDLALGMREDGGGLYATLHYAADLFDASTIERMGGHLRTLLEAIVATPERCVSDLPLLTERERAEQALWYAGPPVGGGFRLFPAQFAARAAQAPHAVALVHDGARTTYAELDARANRIAHHLRALGVGPEARVGLCLRRTPELVAAALGILKAGGAYVPVEPHFPPERIAAVMRDSAAAVLMTASAMADSVKVDPSTRVLRMDDAATLEAIAGEPDRAPPLDIHPDSLAVVIYTSGSTGKPKGVMIRHGGVGRFVDWMRGAFPLAPGEVVLGSTSVAFDVHVAELEFALSSGATLLLVENALSVAELDPSIPVAQASMVPTAARELLHLGALPGRVRRLNLAGEALPPELARALYAAGVPEIHNLYGPTEDTVYATHHPVPRGAEGMRMGRPFDGRRAYVLDRRMNPAPTGVEGDVWLAGTGSVRGYLGRPGLTAERFVPDPFGAPGERMYLSGDRGRWMADGTLEYAGRADFQVKVRGFRIELGEIESVLRGHPAVADAAVVAHGAEAARRLAAYLVPAQGENPDAAELAAWLRARLPEYMVPSAFVALAAFPRTASGKLDRKALPEPRAAADARSHVAPSTRTEKVLASLWAEVLDVEGVSASAHFFDLGGHSLLATRVLGRIRQAFQVELPLRALFEAPVLADLARRIDGSGALAALPPVQPAPRDPPPPLAFAQQRLWFLHQLEPEGTAYNVPAALRLRGVPDVAALERALGGIVARHEALRTTFAAAEGQDPVQVIHPPAQFRLSAEPVEDEAEARGMASAEAAAPFDLEHGPLFRARLLRIAPDDHVLLLTLHHAVSDGWSMGVLFRELHALYGAFARGEASPLPPLPVQYADFAVWQRRHLAGPLLDAQLRWWRDRLHGAPAVLALPLDHPRPATQSGRGAAVPVAVGDATAARLRALARAEGATLYMTLLAAFGVLLARWSGQEDVVVGSPVSGRDRGELQELIGFFVNTLPLRADLSGDPPFRELLARMRETVLQAHAHQDVPFERLVEALRVERDTGRPPLFQAMFLLQEGAAGPSLPGLDAGVMEVENATSKFDLTLGMRDGAQGLRGTLQYATDLFEPATIRRMAGHLGVLLDALAADPDRRVSEVPLLTERERAEQASWYAGGALPGAAAPFPAQFAARVAQAPHAVAVIHQGERTSYAQLDARANRMANHLRGLGVGPEVRVGLCLPRTPELVAAALGILKAGGAYVPVEPHLPPERIAAVMRDSGAAVLITTSAVADSVRADGSMHVLRTDDAATGAAVDAESTEAPPVALHPESLAVVIYTSGSTGTPKGVMVRHGGIGAFVEWMRATFPLAPGAVVLGSTSLAFDVHVAEVEFALASGATLLLVENALAVADLDPSIDVAQASMVPTAARELLNLGALPGRVRRLNLAGEALPRDLAQALYAAGTPQVHDLYGPTEDTVYATHIAVPRDPARMLLGRPLDGRRAYVLDRRMSPVPAGVEGDLWLAGCGLARGYLARPALTAEKFVPDPFGAAGERMYHSGDRARWTADGRLQFAGRADFQVKVRGFRIEPGEIESVLRAHPAIADTVVLARGAEAARRLVAYVVPRPGAAAEAAELAAHLRARLPEHMVPAAFVALDAFPRTVSGKLDRKALPEPRAGAAGAAAHVEPRTPTERALAGMWMEILEISRVGAHDDFFDLGGHSLLATRVMGRIRRDLRTELPLRAVFEAPTLSRLAERVDAARRTEGPPAARIRAADRSAYRVRMAPADGRSPTPALAAADPAGPEDREMG